MKKITFLLPLLFFISCSIEENQEISTKELYSIPLGEKTRWISFENHTGEKGIGGMENRGAKGHPYDRVYAGESVVLLDVKGSGVIRRIWATLVGTGTEDYIAQLENTYS